MIDRPLITFALIVYNQEKFIREAVAGAFAQTYSPLEIILSDDCSGDSTFEIMQEMAATYQGSHSIILNRNEINLGIGFHINKVMELSHGELIVAAAGDDISVPERTEEIYLAWIESEKQAFSLGSTYEFIDDCGQTISFSPLKDRREEDQLIHFSKTFTNYVSGCTHAWHRKVFEVFGPLPKITHEDVAIPPRSMLLGRVVNINKPLVKYRVHTNNASTSSIWLTTDVIISRKVSYVNDCIDICKDIASCIQERSHIVNEQYDVNKLHVIINNFKLFNNKMELKKKMITGCPVFRLIYLANYIMSYKLNSIDYIFIICAFSKKLYDVTRRVSKTYKKISIDPLSNK